MSYRLTPRIKICCISSIDEATSAIRNRVSAIGLVSEMPSGPGVISEEIILEIAKIIPPGVSSFLLTSKQNVEDIILQQRKCKTNTIQLCDTLLPEQHLELRRALPGISIVQVVHVTGEESIKEAIELSKNTNGLLLDSGNQSLQIKELGGTGRVHNWIISKEIVKRVNVPVFLAGGLNPSNVKEAIRIVQPFGVDICSGVRTDGKLDEKKLKQFVNNVLNWMDE
ncbi:MAG: phosphoribosylanthranilate isomerase [Ignavibacteriales bacterium]|nr:phosphoribosylanthranilate isomerase [Ignavibacteriales bacterium]